MMLIQHLTCIVSYEKSHLYLLFLSTCLFFLLAFIRFFSLSLVSSILIVMCYAVVCLVKAMVFLVVMYGCESWTIKKAENWRIDAFKLWCWRRLLRFPWTARRSNQSILKELSPEYSLEGQMLKLKLQYFGQLMWRTDSLEKTLMLGKFEGRRRRGRQRMRWLDGITNSMDEFELAPGVGDGHGSLACCSPWSNKELDTTEQPNWTELKLVTMKGSLYQLTID